MVSKGMIRERPRSAQEAREFIKGERLSLHVNFRFVMAELKPKGNAIFRGKKCYGSSLLTGYSDDRAFAVNFVLVTNLSTGATKGGWDIPEVTDEMSRSS